VKKLAKRAPKPLETALRARRGSRAAGEGRHTNILT
jgi:hypothetical protein